MFFKSVVVGDTFWNYGSCFVLLCYKEAVKIFIRIEILVEHISSFNMYGKVVICHYVLTFVRYKESNKFSVVVIWRQKVTCLNKVFIDTAVEKFKLGKNRSFIKFPQNRTLLWYFQELHLQVLFYLRIVHLKYPLLLVLIHLLDHPPVQVLEDHRVVHRFYRQVLFVLHFSLVHVCVIRWQKVTCLNKVLADTAIEKFKLVRKEASSKTSFISSKPYSSLIFSRTSSSSYFLFRNSSSKISSASGPNIFPKPSPSSSFGGSTGIS